MKVKKLIALLKKMPPDLDVYMADHDHSEYETNSLIGDVCLVDKSEMDNYAKHLHKNDLFYRSFNSTDEVYVVIRP
jgi:hypothetical protein